MAQRSKKCCKGHYEDCYRRNWRIIITPLANDELRGPRGAGYRRMIEVSAAGRAGTPDEVAIAALLMGPDGAFINGSDFLMDGGVTAAFWFGELASQ